MDDSKQNKQSKDISATPSITALLKPTADYLGEELKEFVKLKVESAKERLKKENLLKHTAEVQKKVEVNQPVDEPNIQQLNIFEEWVENVSSINPKDKELSGFWHSLLLNSSNSSGASNILLGKLKELDPEDAVILRKFYVRNNRTFSKEERYRLRKLKELELLERNETSLFLVQLILFAGGIFTAYISYKTQIILLTIEFFDVIIDTKLGLIEFMLSVFLPLFGYSAFFIFVLYWLQKSGRLSKYQMRLSWIGKKLVAL